MTDLTIVPTRKKKNADKEKEYNHQFYSQFGPIDSTLVIGISVGIAREKLLEIRKLSLSDEKRYLLISGPLGAEVHMERLAQVMKFDFLYLPNYFGADKNAQGDKKSTPEPGFEDIGAYLFTTPELKVS